MDLVQEFTVEGQCSKIKVRSCRITWDSLQVITAQQGLILGACSSQLVKHSRELRTDHCIGMCDICVSWQLIDMVHVIFGLRGTEVPSTSLTISMYDFLSI